MSKFRPIRKVWNRFFIENRFIDNGLISLFFQLCRFGLVGLTAAAIHFSTVVFLVQTFMFQPLVANIIGFMLAFNCSYWGHKLWTFQDTTSRHAIALPKLLTVQLMNFAANESLFSIFLWMNLPYTLALLLVLTILPIFTFIASKWWVFRVAE